MGIEKVRRWQWMIIALIVGFTIAKVREHYGDQSAAFSNSISQAQFEAGLLQEVKHPRTGEVITDSSGRPRRLLEDVVVYPVNVRDNKGELISFIVAGSYTTGRVEPGKDGEASINYRPAFFPARSPYQPLKPKDGPADANRTVVDFLEGLKDRNVTYRYAWWNEPAKGMALWVGGCFVMIGLVWPTLVNLIAFGQLTRPPEEKGIDLSGVSSGGSATKAGTQVSDAEMERVRALADGLEAQLGQGAGERSADLPAASGMETPVKKLEGGPVETHVEEGSGEDKEFGADPDDFYPTERHARPGQPK